MSLMVRCKRLASLALMLPGSPLIASVNCLTEMQWAEYAKALEGAGVDGIELNLYSPSRDMSTTAAQIEPREM